MPDAPVPASRPTAAQAVPVAREPQRAAASLPPLTVRYFKRMRRQRVYAVVVSCETTGRVRPPDPLVLRLVMAGAQVVPSEHTLDPSKPKPQVTFFVTPLARGWLKGERLEVIQGGKKVQEVKLPSKVTTQRLTWVLLALTFLVPWYIVPYFTTSPIVYTEDVRKEVAEEPKEPKVAQSDLDKRLDKLEKLISDVRGPEKKPIKGGDALRYHLRDKSPHVWPIIKEHAPAVAEVLEKEIPEFCGYLYGLAYHSVNNSTPPLPLGYCTVCVFAVLTALSWVMHLERRKRRSTG